MSKLLSLLFLLTFSTIRTEATAPQVRETIVRVAKVNRVLSADDKGDFKVVDKGDSEVVEISIPGMENIKIMVDPKAKKALEEAGKQRIESAVGVYSIKDIALVRESLTTPGQPKDREFYNKVAANMCANLKGSILLVEIKEGQVIYRFIEEPIEGLDIAMIPLISKDRVVLAQVDTDIQLLKEIYKNHFKGARYHIAGLLAELFKLPSSDLKQLSGLSTVARSYGALQPTLSAIKLLNKFLKSSSNSVQDSFNT